MRQRGVAAVRYDSCSCVEEHPIPPVPLVSLDQSAGTLLDYLKSSDPSFNCFRQQLKHFYFVNIDTVPALLYRIRDIVDALYKMYDTYLHTYCTGCSSTQLGEPYRTAASTTAV